MSDSIPDSRLVTRMRGFGETIFAEMSALAVRYDALNLGQGFPDSAGPSEVLDAAVSAIGAGRNQYPPGRGEPVLRRAIADHQRRWYGIDLDPDRDVLVTAGATEALAAAVLALCEPGDEVIALEPSYDAYGADVALAGGTLVPVRLDAPDFRLNPERLRAAVTPRTRLIILNTPHNPTGHVLTRAELETVAEVARENDLIVITDEVYEHLVFDGREHVPLATLPGMFARTVTIGSGGKTFSVTGWKVGWVTGPAELVDAVTTTKQFLTFSGGGPFQYGVATGLGLPNGRYDAIAAELQAQRDALVPALRATGMRVFDTQSTYFVIADIAPLGLHDSLEFCRSLPERVGVAAVPNQVFYRDPTGVESHVRFAFCKRPEVLAEAGRRLQGLG